MNERLQARLGDEKVRNDIRILGDFVQIFCDGHHAEEARAAIATDATVLGVYGRKTPVLCTDCEAHLAYAETRRAYCPKDPKPFCAHCDTHCYKPDEREWERTMMRYSGKKAWAKGHAIDGIKHMVEGIKARRHMAQAESHR